MCFFFGLGGGDLNLRFFFLWVGGFKGLFWGFLGLRVIFLRFVGVISPCFLCVHAFPGISWVIFLVVTLYFCFWLGFMVHSLGHYRVYSSLAGFCKR